MRTCRFSVPSKGLTREVVDEISRMKGEPDWMLEFRLKSLEQFLKMPMPSDKNSQWFSSFRATWTIWILMISQYYVKPSEKQGQNWDEVPEEIKETLTNWAFRKRTEVSGRGFGPV